MEMPCFYVQILILLLLNASSVKGNGVNSECEAMINVVKDTLLQEMFELKMQNTMLTSRIKKLETAIPVSSSISVPSTTSDDKRLQTMENKIADMESIIHDTAKVSQEVTDVSGLLKKAMNSEKKERILFTSHVQTQLETFKVSLEDFKRQTESEFENTWEKFETRTNAIIENNMTAIAIELDSIIQDVSQLDVEIGSVKELAIPGKKALISAFSAYRPSSIKNGALTYTYTAFQHGADFNTSTGIFSCSIPGIYRFSATLVKFASPLIHCDFRRNGIKLPFNPGVPLYMSETTDQFAAITQEALVGLSKGDTVYLGGCSAPRNMAYWTMFHGYLLYPDV